MTNYARRCSGWNVLWQRLIPASIMTVALFVTSCCATRTVSTQQSDLDARKRDSVSVIVERSVRLLPVPRQEVTLRLHIDTLRTLPTGAEFRQSNGRATVAVGMSEGGVLTASATCDSLTVLVEDLRTEIFHLNAETMTLKEALNEDKTIEVNRPNGWQWFQIWTGRILAGLLAVWLAVKLIIKK